MNHDETPLAQTNLAWLLRLRWGAIGGQLLTILVVRHGLGLALPMSPLLALVGFEALTNAAFTFAPARRRRPFGDGALGAVMALDVLLLSGLLYFTGGPNNPFSFLFLVPISLATLILPAAWTWALVLLSLACSAVLFAWNRPLELGDSHAAHMSLHLRGMWVAFGVSAAFIVHFLRRIRRALAAREAELATSRSLAARQERLASLATLAAGAAHELSTPLSTIAVVAKELERELARLGAPVGVGEDVGLLRGEVERCRAILQRMCADAGQVLGEAFVTVSVDELVARALAGLEPRPAICADVAPGARGLALSVPPRALEQALQGVLKNAQDASPANRTVSFAVARVGDRVEFTVRDEGAGMAPDVVARAGEPFFTTKPAGQGMGLGLFLARTVVERLGGTLTFDSAQRTGTTARIAVPVRTGATP
jgi:two-component system sensor histidine kinase RegB